MLPTRPDSLIAPVTAMLLPAINSGFESFAISASENASPALGPPTLFITNFISEIFQSRGLPGCALFRKLAAAIAAVSSDLSISFFPCALADFVVSPSL